MICVQRLYKAFGDQPVLRGIDLDVATAEIMVIIGRSGGGKSVLLKHLIGLLRPDSGAILVDGTDITRLRGGALDEIRRRYGVVFQGGALFDSMSVTDNIAFPLREHTKKTEAEIRQIVHEKMEMVGLSGEDAKYPGEISGGMRKRAGLARALVLDPQIILCDEPDSGLDPVRTAYLSQLLIDLNAEIDATILIVTHDIQIARTVPDNLGMLFRGNLVMFGPREVLLTSDNPVITQFVNGRRFGPIGMSEEKDEATLAQERALENGDADVGTPALMPQLVPSPGLPERLAVQRRMDRVMAMLPSLPAAAPQAILSEVGVAGQQGADPERGGAQAWDLAREREPAQFQADEDTAVLEEQDEPGRWPRDWPGGGG